MITMVLSDLNISEIMFLLLMHCLSVIMVSGRREDGGACVGKSAEAQEHFWWVVRREAGVSELSKLKSPCIKYIYIFLLLLRYVSFEVAALASIS